MHWHVNRSIALILPQPLLLSGHSIGLSDLLRDRTLEHPRPLKFLEVLLRHLGLKYIPPLQFSIARHISLADDLSIQWQGSFWRNSSFGHAKTNFGPFLPERA